MNLYENTFTRENIEKVLCNGGTLDCYRKYLNPIIIFKLGPPGAGKSSAQSNLIVEQLGVNPADAVKLDVDKVTASFPEFREKTRTIRKRYNNGNTKKRFNNTVRFNNNFYKNLSNVHLRFTSLKNKASGKNMITHSDALLVKAIKSKKNIIFDTIRPLDKKLPQFLNMLHNNNYRTYIIFHMTDIDTLSRRIHKRGENLYEKHNYYRAFNMETLPSVIQKLMESLENYLKPLEREGKITGILYI